MKSRNIIKIVTIAFIAFVILLAASAKFITDLLWFDSLGFNGVFWTMYESRYLLWLAGFVVFFVIMIINLRIALRSGSPYYANARVEQVVNALGKYFTYLVYGGAAVLGLFMAGILNDSWLEMQQFIHAESFGTTDPIFGHDIGFYMFTLPFLNTIRGWLLGTFILVLLASGTIHFIRQGISVSLGQMKVSSTTRKHMGVLLAVIFVLIAAGFWLNRFDILYSTRSRSFFGAGYTDVNAQLPAYWIMVVISLLTAVGFFFLLVRRELQVKRLVQVFAVFILSAIIVNGIFPALMQKFIVDPNEQEKELPFIANNIRLTRLAYDLNRIEERDFAPTHNLTSADVLSESATIRNIMLWDYRPLASTLDQLQVIRLYYDFPDVDIDRYLLPDGSYRQVMLSARELNQNKLPRNAQTWVNLNLVYTHGYGLGMSPVNIVTQEGLPEFFIKDIPPVSTVGLDVTRPEIYFGEETKTPVVVKGNIEEFDYPLGDLNRMTTYKADAGVSIGSLFRRLIFAINFSDINLLISSYIGPESRILYHRSIHKRVRMIAPFLQFDQDPYLVVTDGKLYWIYDAYTTSKYYPYSKPLDNDFNYIRNSIKIVIDAYTGETKFYLFNQDQDPIVRVLHAIFPDLFTDMAKMPEALHQHIRYPQDLFDIQAEIFETYHMEDPTVFYNKEDLWNIANEKLRDNVVEMESYYLIMRLPGEKGEEFILLVPYTPNKRDNMMAWLCARSDGNNYGKMLVFKFPKQELTYGPMQVSARIDQDPEISQQLTLWNQQGSSVTRGNLLVIPIKEDIMYVQPVYLQATEGKLPELKRVIVAYGNRLSMERTLDQALSRVFGRTEDYEQKPATGTGKTERAPAKSIKKLTQEALQHYERAQEYLKKGAWAKYGEELNQLKFVLEKLARTSSK